MHFQTVFEYAGIAVNSGSIACAAKRDNCRLRGFKLQLAGTQWPDDLTDEPGFPVAGI